MTKTDTSIDGDLLDSIETILRADARGQDHAITSGELAERLSIEDTDANPKTREAVKILMRERGLPVIGGCEGYYIPERQAPIDDAIESLEGRIEGIRERQHLLAENWAAWSNDVRDAATVLTDEQLAKIEADPFLTVEDVLAAREGDA